MAVGFGVAGALSADIIRALAPRLEELQFSTFWVNDTPDGDGLKALADAASVSTTLRLGVGVIPVDRVPGYVIAERIRSYQLPIERLVVGVGSGRATRPLAAVREAVELIRLAEPSVSVAIGALGPQMVQLGAEIANVVLLNWLTPAAAAESARTIRDVRPEGVEATGYVRVAMGEGAIDRLTGEAARYGRISSYANHFQRMGVQAIETSVRGATATELRQGLAAYVGVLDETVARAITAEETIAEYLALAEALAPLAVEN